MWIGVENSVSQSNCRRRSGLQVFDFHRPCNRHRFEVVGLKRLSSGRERSPMEARGAGGQVVLHGKFKRVLVEVFSHGDWVSPRWLSPRRLAFYRLSPRRLAFDRLSPRRLAFQRLPA